MSDANGSGDAGDGGAARAQPLETATPGTSDMPEWYRRQSEIMDRRFEGLAEKLRTLASATEPKPAKQQATEQPITKADIDAAIELGAMMVGLGDDAQAYVRDLAAKGKSYADQADFVRAIRKFGGQPATGNGNHAPAMALPPGVAASANPARSPVHPRNQAEYAALAKAARTDQAAKKRWEDLKTDDTFDPSLLPIR